MATATNTHAQAVKREKATLIWLFALFIAVTLAGVLSPAARLLQYLFPAMAFALSIYAYLHSKAAYTALVCWLWMLSPLVRRLVDYRAGWIPATAVLLAPVLASFAPMPPIINNWRHVADRAKPVIFAAGGLLYGLVIGFLLHNSKLLMANSFIYWVAPICFAFFVCENRAVAEDILKAVETSFVYGLLVLSAYGLYQFVFMPPWDAFWMENSNLNSIGKPIAFQVRVFGTLNQPQALGAFLVMGLFFTFQSKSRVKFVSIPMALLTLILTASRSAWIGFIIGLLYLFLHFKNKQRLQIVAFALAGVLLVFVAFQTDVKQTVFARVQSLSDPGHDYSFLSRYDGYGELLPDTLDAPYGAGIGFDDPIVSKNGKGMGSGDSAIIALLFSLGYPGSAAYVIGLLMLSPGIFRSTKSSSLQVLKASSWALLFESVLTNTLQGPGGFFVWMALTLCFYLSGDLEGFVKQERGSGSRLATASMPAD